MVNALKRQGVEVHTATSGFKAGSVDVAAGDYIIRGDQPYRTLVDMYFSVQNYPPANPRPYDDTGWTMQYMRNIKVSTLTDKAVLDQPMTMLTADAKAPGGIEGSGGTVVVEHTGDVSLVTLRFANPDMKMLAAEEDFDLGSKHMRAGAVIIPDADRSKLDSVLKDLGLSAWAVASAPSVKTHEMKIPRIGYVHSWSRTQDEGWVRAALDHYHVPYTYFGDIKLREGNLRSKYDVIVFPHVGGNSQSMIAGVPKTGSTPLPYKKTADTPNLGGVDEADDIRGGMGFEGLTELGKFVQEGGTLIADGSTASLMAEYDLASGVTVEHPANLFARGTILRGTIADAKSPIAYGYEVKDLPVYFNQDPVFSVPAAAAFGGFGRGGGFGGGGFGGGRGGAEPAGVGMNVTPNAAPIRVAPLEPDGSTPASEGGQPGAGSGRGGRGGRGGRAAAAAAEAGGQFPGAVPQERPRTVIQFGSNANDLLLSGTLAGGDSLAGRAAVVDVTLGKGHMVLFALRPFWRWQTQGTYTLAFNAIMNWDHLDAGKAPPPAPAPSSPANQ
jgi:hypothetical protein